MSVGSVNVVVLLSLREIDNYFGRTLKLSDKHSGWIRLIEIDVAIAGCEKKTC